MKKGNKYGVLIGISLVVVYFYAFIGIAIYLGWNIAWPADVMGWVSLALKSLGYLVVGILGFIPVLIASLFFVLRDPKLSFIAWPLVITLIYAFIPIPVPGPIDEAIVFALGYWMRTRIKHKIREKEERYDSNRGNRREVIDVEKVK